MKKNLLILTLSIFIVSACSANTPAATQAVVEQSATAEIVTESLPATVEPAAGATEVSYSKDIMPILFGSCTECHGTERVSRNLDLRTYESMMKGSQNGAVILPGDSAGSSLVKSILSGKMPKKGTKLSEEQKNLFIQWVDQGAKNN
jgi:uncharacterized membrane protein